MERIALSMVPYTHQKQRIDHTARNDETNRNKTNKNKPKQQKKYRKEKGRTNFKRSVRAVRRKRIRKDRT